MASIPPLSREVLSEDFQIIRVTLETIADDVRTLSTTAADALAEALAKLELAHRELTALSSRPLSHT